ncbi:MAG: hypothetical protein AB7E95_12870 [Kiritimatiellales bacterium]
MVQTSVPAGKEISEELRPVLIALGRGLGTISVYGTDHPTVDQIVDQTFDELQTALKNRAALSIGTFNGTLTVDEEPVIARDVPIRTLEKRLMAMKVSHLALNRGLIRSELKKLLSALCAPNDEQMKSSLSQAGLKHIRMSDVKYVALREGQEHPGSSTGGGSSSSSDTPPSVQVNQILAFLKGEPSTARTTEDVKNMLSDPERLGQMILEAAAVRQSAAAVHDGESLADIVVGCLRRTYDGLRKEREFESAQGKVNLTKAMMLLEKSVLDKVHRALGARHPDIDRRIFDAIREMEEEQQFELLTAHYFDQRRKMEKVEEKIVENIRKQGVEKAQEQFAASDIDPKDWQRLVVRAGGTAPALGGGFGTGGKGSGLDMGALAVVLEKIEGLMTIDYQDPAQAKTAIGVTRNGVKNYTDRIESRIHELEGQIELDGHDSLTIEDHAEHLGRKELMLEVSRLTLALLQPLTVVNAAVEAAMRHAKLDVQKDLLDLAHESGKRMQSLTKRLMDLVGYPVLES